jgi:hypothetical protein
MGVKEFDLTNKAPFAKGGRRAFFARRGDFATLQISPPRKKHASTLFFKEGVAQGAGGEFETRTLIG